VQLIKSLFCWHGFDNRQRFAAINIACFIAFILLNQILSNYTLGSIAILLLCSSACLASTVRRINDALLPKKWVSAPAASFLIVGLIVIFLNHDSSNWLLLIPLCITLFLVTYPSKNKRKYILGYNGPVDLEQVKKVNTRQNRRVEPTMNNSNVNQHQPTTNESHHVAPSDSIEHSTSTTNETDSNSDTQQVDIGEAIRLTLLSRKNARLTAVVVFVALILALLISMMFSDKEPTTPLIDTTSTSKEVTASFKHQLALPDNFSIMFSSDNALVIHWQANISGNSEIWALATAMGDKKCENIAFDTKTKIRTSTVSVVDSNYYAYFSPLDTKALIKNIAFKSNFSLCGHNFSLKGSQAALGKSNYYVNLVEY
jgi:hypothetical protein